MSSKYVAIFVALTVLGLSAALAQHTQTAATTCSSSTRGSPTCPTYTAPAATAVPSTSMDGSINVAAQTSTTLFKGAVPANAFMVRTQGNPENGNGCVVNDNGPANGNGAAGFVMVPDLGLQSATFVTPTGYKPIGPVSIWCTVAQYVAARAW